MRRATIGFALVIFLFAAPARAAEWKWEIVPYLWSSDVTVDVLVDDMQIASQTVDFSDLIDKADIGALVHFEGRLDRWGFFVDLTYLELSDDQTITGHPLFADGTRVDAEMDQLLWEVGAAVRVLGGNEGLDILFGVRMLDISVDVNFDFPVITDQSRSRDMSWVDGFAGVRYRGNLGERWLWWARADAGTGDTDLSWQGILGFGLRLGETGRNTLVFGYRHLVFEGDEENDSLRSIDLEFSGPLVGFRFGF